MENFTQNNFSNEALTAETTAVQQYSYDQNFALAANMLLHQDKNSYEVKRALLERGVSDSEAELIVDKVENEINDAVKARANKDMLWGAVWCIGGIIVTAATYSAASNGGGRYFVAWGAILFGGIQFLKGLIANNK